MKIYIVGGAVRDRLLGRAVSDRDWVVVGATPEQMLAQGFLPVGRDFPVFLHPKTREEYALARTERKSGRGYRGFVVQTSPEVTLEEDLARRDLTINAIAASADWASSRDIFDPYNGQRDLQQRVLRHVTDAFREDPVRILRVARFAARFTDFSVAPETMALMCEMVAHGEADHLVAERVWQELARGLMEAQPSRMFKVLRDCGALAVVLPEVNRLWGVPQRAQYHPEICTGIHLMMVLDMAARLDAPLAVRFACLTHDLARRPRRRTCCRATSATSSAARSCSKGWQRGCACQWTAAKWPTWWRASTATSTEAANWVPPHWCGCWSAATPSASPSALPTFCWPASATRAGDWAWKNRPTRSASGWAMRCWRCSRLLPV